MIKLYNFDELKPEEILNRDLRAEKNVEDVVDAIIADVRTRGDEALKEYALKFDPISWKRCGKRPPTSRTSTADRYTRTL